jgi:DNA-binding NarL/FixJ family response regulator
MSSSLQPIRKETGQSVSPGDSFYGQPNVILLDEKHWQYIQRRYRLSTRELEVARLVCRGLTNGDMADKLRVRPGTVKTHLRSIFGKTRVRNKITMLLRFMHDVTEFFGESDALQSVALTDTNGDKPSGRTPGH